MENPGAAPIHQARQAGSSTISQGGQLFAFGFDIISFVFFVDVFASLLLIYLWSQDIIQLVDDFDLVNNEFYFDRYVLFAKDYKG